MNLRDEDMWLGLWKDRRITCGLSILLPIALASLV